MVAPCHTGEVEADFTVSRNGCDAPEAQTVAYCVAIGATECEAGEQVQRDGTKDYRLAAGPAHQAQRG